MSLWLQAVTWAFERGDYHDVRVNLLPIAPIPMPGCLYRELEFAEHKCRDIGKDPFFPLRYLWLMEGHEQGLLNLSPLGRSYYHPEILLELWTRSKTDDDYRQECESTGIQFDRTMKAVKLDVGWIYIGEQFVEDFLEIEKTLGIELLFPNPPAGEGQPAFQQFKQRKPRGSG